MGKLIVTEFVTLDGVAQAPGGPDENRDGGSAHGGWQAPPADQESGGVIFEQARSMDALLLGRRTYEIFADYWPSAPQEIPFTPLLNRVPRYVASRTLAGSLVWPGSTLVADDLAEDITAIKGRHDEVHVIGSLDLLQSPLRFGLVDRMNLWLYPLLRGSAKRVFADGTARSLRHSQVPKGILRRTGSRHSGCIQFGHFGNTTAISSSRQRQVEMSSSHHADCRVPTAGNQFSSPVGRDCGA